MGEKVLEDFEAEMIKITHKIIEPDKFIQEYNRHLRYLAIKWIKFIEKIIKEIEGEITTTEKSELVNKYTILRHKGSITWIKHFFRITDKDLK